MAVTLASGSAQHYTRSGFFSNAANAITLMAWCKVSALPGSNEYHNLLSMGGVPGAVGCTIHNNAGTIRWSIGTAANDYDATNYPAPATTDPWFHIAMTRNTNGDLALYVNGLLARAANESFTGQTALWIGVDSSTDAGTAAAHWDGPIAAVKAWDGCALNVDEIAVEKRQMMPAGIRVGQLRGVFPFFTINSDTLDWSGHEQILTRTSTPTSSDMPPVPLYFDPTFLDVYDGPAAAAAVSTVIARPQSRPFPFAPGSSVMSGQL
jgi:hypothetical protein